MVEGRALFSVRIPLLKGVNAALWDVGDRIL